MGVIEEIVGFIVNFDKIKKIFRNTAAKLKYLFWSKKEKTEWEELIRKHQFPKDIPPTYTNCGTG